MQKLIITIIALLLAVVGGQAWAESRWVASEGTTLKAEAAATSDNLADLPVGTEVSVLEDAGRWLKVKTTAGKEGWLYTGRVADAPPAAEVTGGDGGIFGGSMQQSQINTAKADSARSIRGLSPEVAQYAKQRGTPEGLRKALDGIVARKVSPKEVRAFLQEGKIGEYAP